MSRKCIKVRNLHYNHQNKVHPRMKSNQRKKMDTDLDIKPEVILEEEDIEASSTSESSLNFSTQNEDISANCDSILGI